MVQALVSSNQQPQNLDVAASGETPLPSESGKKTKSHSELVLKSTKIANGEFQNLKVHLKRVFIKDWQDVSDGGEATIKWRYSQKQGQTWAVKDILFPLSCSPLF